MSIWDALAEDLESDFGIETFVEHDEDGYTVVFKLNKPYEVGNQGQMITEEAWYVLMTKDVLNVVWRKYHAEKIKKQRIDAIGKKMCRAPELSPYQNIKG
jgi:hypothetical protein